MPGSQCLRIASVLILVTLGLVSNACAQSVAAPNASGTHWSGQSAFGPQEVAPVLVRLSEPKRPLGPISNPPILHDGRKWPLAHGSEGPVLASNPGDPGIATPNMLRTWVAMSETDRLPDGVDIAVGTKRVVVATGNRLAVYTKRGDLVWEADMNWLIPTSLYLHEPRVVYDSDGPVFIAVFLGSSSNPPTSKQFVIVMPENLLDQGWAWIWDINASNAGLWATHTSMGQNWDSEVCIANDMYTFAGDFQYAQARYLPKAKLRAGEPLTYYTYWGMMYDGSYAQRLQVAEPRQYNPHDVILAATKPYGGDSIRIWITRGPFSNPFTVTIEKNVGCWAYTYPPDAPQYGSGALVATGYAWLTSAVAADQYILLSHTVGYSFSGTNRPIFRVYAFHPGSDYVEWQQQVGWADDGAYIPIADFDPVPTTYVGFNYSNTSWAYPSSLTMSKTGDPWLSGFGWIAGGQAPYTRYTWAQYAGSSLDPMGYIIWMAHMHTMSDGKWQIGVGEMSHYSLPDTIPPYGWQSSPDYTFHTQQPVVASYVRDDESGLYPPSGTYWYSRDTGQTWTQVTAPSTPFVSGDEGSNGWQRFTTLAVPFDQDSMTKNLITFRVEDMYRNISWSPVYVIPVDTRAPEDWAGFYPDTIVNGGVHTCSVMVHDITSGLNVITAYYRFSTNSGATWSAWTPANCTGSNGTTDYQTLTASDVPFNHSGVLGENLIQFRVQDMFGNQGEMTYAVRIDKLARLEGKITLADFEASPLGIEATLQQFNGAVLMETVTTNLRSDGGYVVWFRDAGGTHIRAKTPHHLSRRVAKVLSGLQTNFLDLTLPYNGDGDGNNEIGLPDLNLVMINFTKSRHPADYNGSGQVDLPDMNLVMLNFAKSGE
ncbi:MAG: hypothetical protein HRF45_02520 [Fimbriimonadia bacterium]